MNLKREPADQYQITPFVAPVASQVSPSTVARGLLSPRPTGGTVVDMSSRGARRPSSGIPVLTVQSLADASSDVPDDVAQVLADGEKIFTAVTLPCGRVVHNRLVKVRSSVSSLSQWLHDDFASPPILFPDLPVPGPDVRTLCTHVGFSAPFRHPRPVL